MRKKAEKFPPVPLNVVSDAILTVLDEMQGFFLPSDEIHLETSKQVGNFFLNFKEILDDLVEDKMIRERVTEITPGNKLYGYEILPKGTKFLELGGYAKQANEKSEIERLTKQKLMIDVTNAENVYKSYPMTKNLAIGGFIIAVILGVLKVLEALRLL